LVYATVIAAIYLRFGKLPPLTLPVVAFLTLLTMGVATRSKEFIRTSVLFVTVILTYEALQGLTGALISSGSVVSLAGLDRVLVGSNFVLDVQTMFYSPATTFVSTIFYGLHVFLIAVALGLFWLKDKVVYRCYMYSMVITSYLALLTFIIIPTAPPWYVGAARNLLVAGNRMLPSTFQSVQTVLLSGESDIFAAFPSLHAAYATLFSVFMFKLGKKYGLVSLPIAFGVYFSIIYLGQHYLVDLLGGIAYAMLSVYIVEKAVLDRRETGFRHWFSRTLAPRSASSTQPKTLHNLSRTLLELSPASLLFSASKQSLVGGYSSRIQSSMATFPEGALFQ
jgi:membrane-associated phospholipid phosphatase